MKLSLTFTVLAAMIIAASACPRSQKVDNCCCQSCDLTSCSTPEWEGNPGSERPDDTALWVDLSQTQRDNLFLLGWSVSADPWAASSWDSCDAIDWPSSEDECWQGLSDSEKSAAAAIGWGLCSWNDCQWRDV